MQFTIVGESAVGGVRAGAVEEAIGSVALIRDFIERTSDSLVALGKAFL